MSKAVITWGRLNPVTIGHEKLVNKVKSGVSLVLQYKFIMER